MDTTPISFDTAYLASALREMADTYDKEDAEKLTNLAATVEASNGTLDREIANQVKEALTEYSDGGCDHSVGICTCETEDLIEEINAALEGRETWWEALDRIQGEEGYENEEDRDLFEPEDFDDADGPFF